ncbi:multiple epidermal growth factor-like domains protein 6 isoform X2 [Pecten maximus]|uniref:multiple epidermal growth factor-like domains protein 6 isoform X2 n=1 Tax=Pecten maximus TaxID=6579 RepID=UPI00145857F4|nr:multiple epidermal growth factor-like domains protein 6 isoform X2 [Pecten maximus]
MRNCYRLLLMLAMLAHPAFGDDCDGDRCNGGNCDSSSGSIWCTNCPKGKIGPRCEENGIIICERVTYTIECPVGEVLNIQEAFYGREDQSTCSGMNQTLTDTNCSSSVALERYGNLCNYKHICTVTANNSVTGDPCPGTYKYARIRYTCIASVSCDGDPCNGGHCGSSGGSIVCTNCPEGKIGSRCEIDGVIICERKRYTIECPVGKVLNIQEAFYGREDQITCSGMNQPLTDTNCSSSVALERYRNLCNYKHICLVTASNSVTGDPCPGTYKYARIRYTCIASVSCDGDLCNGGHCDYSSGSIVCTNCPEGKIGPRCDIDGVIICERERYTIECPSGEVINIQEAFYGRKDQITCLGMNQPLTDTNCSSSVALERYRNLCNYKHICLVTASNSVTGDPCPGTYKYARIRYTCIASVSCDGDPCNGGHCDYSSGSIVCTNCPEGKIGPRCDIDGVIICERERYTIECPSGEVINIQEAFYGRKDQITCSGMNQPLTDTNCSSSVALERYRNLCNYKHICLVTASNRVTGDPCPGTYKYARIRYTCIASVSCDGDPCNGGHCDYSSGSIVCTNCPEGKIGPRCDIDGVIICERERYTIECPSGEVINIQEAFYGRKDQITCSGMNQPLTDTNCSSSVALERYRNLCNYKHICLVTASNRVTGDPCPGTYKYARIRYTCIASVSCDGDPCNGGHCDYSSGSIVCTNCPEGKIGPRCDIDGVIICERERYTIECPSGEVINIQEAFYGRKDQITCSGMNQPLTDTNCSSSVALERYRNLCNYKHICLVTASNRVTGDPCPGTYKYARIRYTCIASVSCDGDPCNGGHCDYSSGSIVCTNCPEGKIGPRCDIDGVIICERERYTIECPSGEVINIQEAFYGRKDQITCSGMNQPLTDTNCSSSVALERYRNLCNYKHICLVTASNRVTGDPCPGTYKYARIRYTCIASVSCDGDPCNGGHCDYSSGSIVCTNCPEGKIGPRCDIDGVIICERERYTIECPSGEVINIQEAFYGRKDQITCSGMNQPLTDTNCSSSVALERYRNLCNYKHICLVTASNRVTGDPCPGTYKYARIRYTCIASVSCDGDPCNGGHCDYSSGSIVCTNCPEGKIGPRCDIDGVIICERERYTIECPSGEVINIQEAFYGRKDQITCSGMNQPLTDTNCSSSVALERYRNLCNYKHICLVTASNRVTGDPCPGTYKYARIRYTCIASVSCDGDPCNGGHCGSSSGSIVCTNCPEGKIGPRCEIDGVIICERVTYSIECPVGKVINIHEAFYGREDQSTCSGMNQPLTDTNCSSSVALERYGNLCNYKHICLVTASNSVTGDPCPGTYKYARIRYTCIASVSCDGNPCNGGHCDYSSGSIVCTNCPEGKIGSRCEIDGVIICERVTYSIECPAGQVINIQEAFYGRDDQSTCSCINQPLTDTNCSSAVALERYGNLCNYKHICSVTASNSMTGDPCPGTYKYARIRYTCIASVSCDGDPCNGGHCGSSSGSIVCTNCPEGKIGPRCEIDGVIICERVTYSIECPVGKVINIQKAFYGREDQRTCSGMNQPLTDTNCSSSVALERYGNLCNYKHICTVTASNSVTGDPCPGTYKYARIRYTCIASVSCDGDLCNGGHCDYSSGSIVCTKCPEGKIGPRCEIDGVIICERVTYSIECPAGEVINIQEAFYGREDQSTCSGMNQPLTDTNCSSSVALERYRNLCNYKHICLVTASNSVTGDPCPGTYKYARIRYTCIASVSCDGDPCNGGHCESSSGSIVCTNCPEGKIGPRCEIDADVCDPNPCTGRKLLPHCNPCPQNACNKCRKELDLRQKKYCRHCCKGYSGHCRIGGNLRSSGCMTYFCSSQ